MRRTLTAIDLFAGAGGLSLGFEQAGFLVPVAIERDVWATETFEKNRSGCKVVQADITQLSDSFFNAFTGIDVIMGGPPCQGFSISASNRRDPNDPRNFLYRDFLRAVKVIKPRMVFIENVKEISTARIPSGELLLQDLCKILRGLGYEFTHSLLNAADFGVPQSRIRFFLAAGLNGVPNLQNYRSFGVESPLFKCCQPYLTLWDAISDLPSVAPRNLKEDETLNYDKEPANEYQRRMRDGCSLVYNHIPMRHTDRMMDRFRLIPIEANGKVVPNEYASRKRGNPEQISESVYGQNHRRLNPNKPFPTITASFYSSFIHPYEHRNLTVREAARAQGFPDNYRFYGKRTTLSKKLLHKKGILGDMHLDQFNQVGNAVPPILARALAEKISDFLLNRSSE